MTFRKAVSAPLEEPLPADMVASLAKLDEPEEPSPDPEEAR